jgi:uncharacterized membrane protein YeaQ/YmgE (transglycosylase-associated protein family)
MRTPFGPVLTESHSKLLKSLSGAVATHVQIQGVPLASQSTRMFGLIAGAISRFLMPSKAPGRFVLTIILGILGGGRRRVHRLTSRFWDLSGFDLRSMLLAVGAGVLVLCFYGLVAKGRA